MNIQRIPVPTPFAVGEVNAYLIEGEPLTLVDCGPLTDEAWEALKAGAKEAGHKLAMVKRLVLTHPHHDHAGLARRLRQISGCRVFAHPVDHARLLGAPGEWERIRGFLVEVCRRAGVPPSYLRELDAALEAFRRYTEPVDDVDVLAEGECLGFANAWMATLHTPGHARGALCLWEPLHRVLLSGDTLIPHISSNAILEPDAERFRQKTLIQYLETLRRIDGLRPDRVLPGHGKPMGNPGPLIAERLEFHEMRARRILELVHEGAERPWEIAHRLFPEIEPAFVFLAVSEVVGHLDLLVNRGEVEFDEDQAPWEIRLK